MERFKRERKRPTVKKDIPRKLKDLQKHEDIQKTTQIQRILRSRMIFRRNRKRFAVK